jgi:hypothetical protein
MRAVIVFVLLLVSACTQVQIGGTSNASAASTTGAGLQVQGGGALTVVLVAATLVAGATQDLREPRPFRPFYDWTGTRAAPEMKPDRAVSEQDCTKPIDLSSGNLRCR